MLDVDIRLLTRQFAEELLDVNRRFERWELWAANAAECRNIGLTMVEMPLYQYDEVNVHSNSTFVQFFIDPISSNGKTAANTSMYLSQTLPVGQEMLIQSIECELDNVEIEGGNIDVVIGDRRWLRAPVRDLPIKLARGYCLWVGGGVRFCIGLYNLKLKIVREDQPGIVRCSLRGRHQMPVC